MIARLKIRVLVNFDKKLLEISFVQYVACDQVRDGRRNEGKGQDLIVW